MKILSESVTIAEDRLVVLEGDRCPSRLRPAGWTTAYRSRYIKKTRLLFYTDAYEKWEAKWMPQAEVAPAT